MDTQSDKQFEIKLNGELLNELIAMPGADYNRLLEFIRRKRFERAGVAYHPDNPAGMDTPEG